MNALQTALLIGTLASSCLAQAFNVDFGPSGSPVPDVTFGAAAAQPGLWNNITNSREVALRTTSGELSNVRCTITGNDFSNQFPSEGTGNSGDFSALMDDDLSSLATSCTPGRNIFVSLRGLARGTYRFYLYATRPQYFGPIETLTMVNGSPSAIWLTGFAASDTFESGRNYSVHDVQITTTLSTNLLMLVSDQIGDTSICGLQVVPISLEGCTIAQQPEDINAEKDQTISFTASIQGDVRSIQWLKDGQPLADVRGISGSTTNTLTISQVRRSDNGQYSLRYTCGSLTYTTQPGTLTVDEPELCPSDFNQDGGVDGRDVDAFFALWESGC